jgi:hypothetical protein
MPFSFFLTLSSLLPFLTCLLSLSLSVAQDRRLYVTGTNANMPNANMPNVKVPNPKMLTRHSAERTYIPTRHSAEHTNIPTRHSAEHTNIPTRHSAEHTNIPNFNMPNRQIVDFLYRQIVNFSLETLLFLQGCSF